jgi:hypothetical protein
MVSTHRCGAGADGAEDGAEARGVEGRDAEARGGEDEDGAVPAADGPDLPAGVVPAVGACEAGACDSEPASGRALALFSAESCCAIASAFADSLSRLKP